MSLDLLVKEIEDSLKKELEKISKETTEKINEINREKKKRIDELKKEYELKLTEFEKRIKEKEKSSIVIEKKRMYLKMNEDLLNSLKNKLKQEIMNLDNKSKEKIFKKFYDSASKVMDVGTIVVNKNDVTIAKKIFKGVDVKSDNTILWGLKFISKDGIKIIDHTLDEIVDELIENNKDLLKDILIN